MEDKDRILEIMNRKGMLAKNFCEATGISPASLSHILNGKTKASLPVLKNIVDAFPEFNPLWVLLGEGQMYLHPDGQDQDENYLSLQNTDNVQNDQASGNVQSGLENDLISTSPNTRPVEMMFDFPNQQVKNQSALQSDSNVKTGQIPSVKEVVKIFEKRPRKIVEIRVFYDDGTYETFS